MARAGLLTNPLLPPTDDPTSPLMPPGSSGLGTSNGLGSLQTALEGISQLGQRASESFAAIAPPPAPAAPSFGFNAATNQFFAKGRTFAADDYQAAVESADTAGTAAPLPQGFQPLSEQQFSGYVQSIRNPSMGTLAARNFGRGVDQLQMLAGRGLQLAGAEELGGGIVERQVEDLRKTTPYERQFTDIQSGGDAVDWFVANLSQQGPMLLEAIGAGLAGMAVGTASGGPVGGALGALGGLVAKGAWKQSVLAAARKKAAGEALDVAESQLLKKAAALGGATAAATANSLQMGASDIYGELRDQGAGADDFGARLTALAGSIPYAAMDLIPEYALASRLLSPAAATAGRAARRGDMLRRVAKGAAAGGALEGATEMGQEAELLALSGQDFSNPENVKRLVNSFAAGFAIGAPFGGAANLRRGKPTDVLGSGSQTEPQPGQMELPLEGGASGTFVGPQQAFAANVRYPDQIEMFPGQDLGVGPGGQQLELPFGREPTPVGTQFDLPLGQPSVRDEQQLELPFAPVEPPVVDVQFGLPFEQGVPQAPPRQPRPPLLLGYQANDQGELNLTGGAAVPMASGYRPTQGEMFPVSQLGQAPAMPQGGQMELPFAMGTVPPESQLQLPLQQPVADQGFLPFEQGLPPARGTQFEMFPGAELGVAPGQAALMRREVPAGTQLDLPLTGFTPGRDEQLTMDLSFNEEQAASEWRRTAPKRLKSGRPRSFQNLHPKTKQEWMWALRDAVAGKLDMDDLRRVRSELETAHDAARLQGKEPRTVYQDPDLTPPEPPKGDKPREDKKPKSDAVAGKESTPSGAAKLRAKGTTGEATREAPAAAAQPAEKKASEQPVRQPEKKPVRETVVETPPYASAEEAWDDMKPQGAPGLNEKTANNRFIIPAMFRGQWQNIFKSGKASIERAKQVYDQFGSELNALLQVRQAIALMEEDTRSISDAFVEAADTLVEFAFFTTEETNTKEAISAARAALVRTDFAPKQWQAITDAFVSQANEKKQREATYVQGDKKGNPQPWMRFAYDNNLIKKLKTTPTNTTALPQEIKDALEKSGKVAPAATAKATQESKAVDPQAPLATLVRFMAEYLKRGRLAAIWDNEFVFEGRTYSYGPRGFAEDMFAEIDPADTAAQFMGTPISAYFNKDGSLRLVEGSRIVSGGNEFVTLKIGTAEDAKRGPVTAAVDTTLVKGKKEERVAPTEIIDTRTLKPSDTGKFSLSSFNNPETSMSEGSIRLAVGRFVSKLATKPKVQVYRNQADFKRRNPSLYRKAVAERPEGDFDTAQAAGYSFAGGNVIIFSDRIANEQHLNFVLAHETIGHFGLRGIIPESKFNATMAQVYEASPYIQADVDAFMAQGMSKEEAVEEYLSDFAGLLDTSIVARIWNAIKGALNKLGIKFGDEMVRYLLKQSRSYVRQGKSYIHQTDRVFTDLYLIENGYGPQGTGRFSQTNNLYDNMQAAANTRFARREMPKDMETGWKEFVSYVGPTARKLDRFVSEFLSLQVFRSRKNPGLQRLYEILSQTNGIATRVRVRSNERNATVFNASKDAALRTSDLLYAAQRLADSRITDYRKLRGAPLYSLVDGVLTPNQPEIDRLTEMGKVTFEQARDGFTYPVVDEKGNIRSEKFAGINGLTKDSVEWKGYESLRASINEVELELLRARYSATLADRKISFKQFDELVDGGLTPAEQQFVDSLINKYKNMYSAGTALQEDGSTTFDRAAMRKADEFLVAVNKSILNLEEGYTEIAAFFEGKMADDTVAKLRELSKRVKLGEDKFVVQTRMKNLLLEGLSTDQADMFARRTLATGYTPLLREGEYQIRLQAIDTRTGQPVKLDDDVRDKLVYMQMESERDAIRLRDEITELLSEDGKPKEYELKVFDQEAKAFVTRKVRLVVKAERSLDAITGPPQLNLNEFQYGLRQLNISLTPDEVQNVVIAMTRQNNAARNRLSRGWVPGADRDAVKAISKHIDSRASTIAKTEMRPYLNELMNLSMRESQLLWNGDATLLANLKKQSEDTNLTPEQRNLSRREYVRYKHMYDTTNPKGGAERGNEFYNEASRTVQFLNENRDVSTSNFEAGAVASRVRSFTSMVQLGGSMATAILNFLGVYTNAIPFLASYNERNGFGGGFGAGAAISEYHRAFGQVGTTGFRAEANTADYYEKLAKNKDALKRAGLEAHEAAFIAREIREGRMIPAQSNALVNTSRGRTDSPFLRRFNEVWMTPFNLSEQAARRSLGLAAYRLEYARQKAAGVSDEKAIIAARQFAAETLDVTMGEYGVLNRPPAWRSGIQSFLYMYKVYPTTAIQLLANMSRPGQIAMLGLLLVASGLQGLPFAEDLEDLVDTLAQALGLTMGSVRAEVAKLIDSTLPGASVPFLQGFIGQIIPGDIGSRMSLGNVVPGTGIVLAGADVTRELSDIAGPMPSAMIQSAKTIYNALRLPFSEQVTLPDVMRESPVTMMRVAGDVVAYAEAGAVVDKRGYTVSGDATVGTVAARILGFYPTDAARQYAAIRIATRITDYQRDVITSYRTAWVRAKVAGDNEGARDIEQAVVRWNKDAEGTGLRINNFVQGSQRALREAQRPAGERALRTTPMANRSDIATVYDLMGATE